MPLEIIAAKLSEAWPDMSPEQAHKTLRRMEDEGSRFIHLENSLGRGAAFVLSSKASDLLLVP